MSQFAYTCPVDGLPLVTRTKDPIGDAIRDEHVHIEESGEGICANNHRWRFDTGVVLTFISGDRRVR